MAKKGPKKLTPFEQAQQDLLDKATADWLKSKGVQPSEFEAKRSVKATLSSDASGSKASEGFDLVRDLTPEEMVLSDIANDPKFVEKYTKLVRGAAKKMGIPFTGAQEIIDSLENLAVSAEKVNDPIAGVLRKNLDALLAASQSGEFNEASVLNSIQGTPALATKLKAAAKKFNTIDEMAASIFTGKVAATPPMAPPPSGTSPPVEPPTQGKPPAGVEDAPTKPIKFPEQPPPLRLVNEGGPPISFAEGQRRRGLEAALGSSRRGRAQGVQAKASASSGASVPPSEAPVAPSIRSKFAPRTRLGGLQSAFGVAGPTPTLDPVSLKTLKDIQAAKAASPVPIPDTVPPVPDVPTTAYGRAVGGLKSLVGGVVADESAILADAGALASKGKLLSATGKLASGGLGSLLLGGLISGSGERAASLYGAATTPTPEAGDIYNTIKAQEIIKRRMREALMSNPELSGALRSQLQAQQINERGYTPNEVQLGGGPQFDDPQGLANFLGV